MNKALSIPSAAVNLSTPLEALADRAASLSDVSTCGTD
jgi:hypothetical protein